MSPSTAPLETLLQAEARRDLPACAAALRVLAAALRAEEGGPLQEALTDRLLAALDLVTPPGTSDAAAWREAVWDSAVDLVADGPGLAAFLDLAASRIEQLRAEARPNLFSMLRARAHWRARDRMRAAESGRAARARAAADETSGDAHARLVAGLSVQGAARRFQGEPHLLNVLHRLLQGESISEVAEGTGLSRQAIYRGLARVRRWIADVAPGAPERPRRSGGSHV